MSDEAMKNLLTQVLPYILSALAPVVLGLLQQVSVTVREKAPWYLKSILTMIIGAAITYVTNLVNGGDVSALVGAAMGAVGSVNIAMRRGPSRVGIS